ncbi:MAG: hypothetical protein HQ492_04955 [Woeseiaceae bacterium]|nr:hypothetical protein [Woeseiaceae bacterium]
MTNPPEIRALEPWDYDGVELSLEINMEDDDLLFEELADDVADAEDEQIDFNAGVASRRRIEMAKEDKYLQSVLADLDDYYDFDDDLAASSSQ